MFLEKLENFNKMFKKENDLKLIFKDKKNRKWKNRKSKSKNRRKQK